MSTKITVKGTDGQNYQFVDDGSPMQGGMKDVYFSPDRSYVVAFFRDKQDFNSKERLDNIVNKYRKGIFENVGGEYWKNLFCWPYALVE
ncbi:MAG TPA: kinase, partial [Verrucomicrobiales bacterium]|nr:kinase [Verrucomicrobiales bacterium]